MCITYLTLKSAKTFREGAQNYSSVPSRFVNCLRGKISLCDLLTLSYPLFSKGELSFCKSCCGWGREGGRACLGEHLCPSTPNSACRRGAGNSRPLFCQADPYHRCYRHFTAIIIKAEFASPGFIRWGNKQ